MDFMANRLWANGKRTKKLKLEIRFSNILMDAMKIWQIFNA